MTPRWSSLAALRRAPHGANPHQVVSRRRECECPADPVGASQFCLPHRPDRLHPAEHLLDPFTDAQARSVRGVPGCALVQRTAALLGRDVRRDARFAKSLDEIADVVAAGATECTAAFFPSLPSISRAASRSAVPVASVSRVSTTKPLRFSIRTWPCSASSDSVPLRRARRASGSVVDSCVAFVRRSPRKSTVGLPGSPSLFGGGPSLGFRLFWLAHALISVPSTVKCSFDSSDFLRACSRTSSKKARAMSPSSRRSRFFVKTEWSQTASSIARPTNQRNSRL